MFIFVCGSEASQFLGILPPGLKFFSLRLNFSKKKIDLFVAFFAGRFSAITTGHNCTAGHPGHQITSSANILLGQVDGITEGLMVHFINCQGQN